ncbi:MAG TPA: hypothetical protein VG222_00715, partial [Vicinamibacterales bacterium]|nr:hypothetical protein [Vicinamibacterales bacterium]
MRLCRALRLLEAVLLLLVSTLVLATILLTVGLDGRSEGAVQAREIPAPVTPPVITAPPGAATVEQKAPGIKP